MSYLASLQLPESIDSPAMRRAGPELLSLALMDARNHSLHLLTRLAESSEALCVEQLTHPGAPSALWLAGHVGWFAEHWIARNTQRALGLRCPSMPTRLAAIEPQADLWWDPAQRSSAIVQCEPGPDLRVTKDYLLETLETTLELLDKAADEDDALYFYRLALFHEDLRGEQLLTLAQAAGLPMGLPLPSPHGVRAPLSLPTAGWSMGFTGPGFAFEQEVGALEQRLPEYEIDAQAVTWAQYLEFVADGGYDLQSCWHPDGWRWLQRLDMAEGRRAPRYVAQLGAASGAVLQTRFGQATRQAGNQCASHLTWWEADAFCRWAGRRLPSEAEWEMAALTAARRGFSWGEVWEWTAGTLQAWPGYSAGPAGSLGVHHWGQARVLRGASFATRARLKHPRFRGFARPERDDLFVGFRTCAI